MMDLDRFVSEALVILRDVGIPIEGQTERRRAKAAKAFLAVAGMKPGGLWSEARCSADGHRLRSRDVLRWMNSYLGESISPGSYDDIRRKDLVGPVEAGLILKSAGNNLAATNDGTRAYAINPDCISLIRAFGTPAWIPALKAFTFGKQSLVEALNRQRELTMIPVKIGDRDIVFSPGIHNQLQKAIITGFLPRFGHGSRVLYVGDTSNKFLFLDEAGLKELDFFEISHDKLPDVLAYSPSRNWLYVIEAVHSANPIGPLRKWTLEKLTEQCSAEIVFVSAFHTRSVFRKFAADIAWETEVWIADNPDHLIHFNGDKFLGPHKLA